MGIHQALLGGYGVVAAPPSGPTWTMLTPDSGIGGGSVSVPNCQPGDLIWYIWAADSGGQNSFAPAGYTQLAYQTDNNPDYYFGEKVITTSGTETVNINNGVDNAVLMGFRSSTGSIDKEYNGNIVYAERTSLSGMPTVPTSNINNRSYPADALAICSGMIDDDNPVDLAAPSPYTFLVAGNVDRGTASSAIMVATHVTTASGNTPPGAGNSWAASAQNSDANTCFVDYIFHGG